MVLKELAVERFRFTCSGCGHGWTSDYDVQHVEDGHGRTWEYYSLDGFPVPPPTARESVCCPRCGATWVRSRLMAVRNVPVAQRTVPVEADDPWPRQPVDPAHQAARWQAPRLRGERPVADRSGASLISAASDSEGCDGAAPSMPGASS